MVIIQASIDGELDSELAFCEPSLLNMVLGESNEPATSIDREAELIALDLLASIQIELESTSSSASSNSSLPVDIAKNLELAETVDRQTKIRKLPVHQVHSSAGSVLSNKSSIRFGGKRSPGARQISFGNSASLEVIVPNLDPTGSRVLSQASNLSLTGGAMMVSTAKPHESLANVPLSFEYDPAQADGSRLIVTAGKQRSVFRIYDWELQPLSRFVNSGHNGAVSIHMFGKQEKVSLDAAFEQTLLGLRFVQADLMPRGIVMSQEYLPQDERGIILGPGETERLSTEQEVSTAMRELESLMARTRNGAPFSVLTDAGVKFLFSIEGKELVVSGTPYFFFWEPAGRGDQVIPKKDLNEALKRAWPKIRQANPVVIDSMERCFRTVSLFRFQKKNSPDNWDRFVSQINTISLTRIPTPSILSAD